MTALGAVRLRDCMSCPKLIAASLGAEMSTNAWDSPVPHADLRAAVETGIEVGSRCCCIGLCHAMVGEWNKHLRGGELVPTRPQRTVKSRKPQQPFDRSTAGYDPGRLHGGRCSLKGRGDRREWGAPQREMKCFSFLRSFLPYAGLTDRLSEKRRPASVTKSEIVNLAVGSDACGATQGTIP